MATAAVEAQTWHAISAAEAVEHLEVDVRDGLSAPDAARRLERDGPNRLAEPKKEPRWRAFLRQFQDLLIIILLIAAVISFVVTREWETPVVIALVVLLNATIGFVQESKAEASLEALKKMLVTTATVRRDGRMVNLDAAELVAGDVVSLQAGDRVPADGRLLTSTGLEVQESSLTGEAQPVGKSATAHVDADAALGDRSTVAFMNTTVTRGHAELVVTATGMDTEIGRIAGMLHEAEPEPTPLQRQIAALSRTLAMIAGAVIVVVFVLGLVRGQDFAALFVERGVTRRRRDPRGSARGGRVHPGDGHHPAGAPGAIVKRLASVETLGSTSQICTDKTGTLTLNQMTAQEMRFADRRFTVSGQGYSTEGRIRTTDGSPLPATVEQTLLAMALCTDSELRDDEVIGDPTEGALLVLAEKGGIDTVALRRDKPRVREVPFDSDYKFMATFHRWTDRDDRGVVRCFIKGAPDVLAARADRYLGGTDILEFDDDARRRYARRQRRACRPRHAGARRRRAGLHHRGARLGRRPEGPARPDRPGRARRHRRPTPAGGPQGDRPVPRRRHPRTDDHRGPRRHRRRHRRGPGHPGRGGDRRGAGPGARRRGPRPSARRGRRGRPRLPRAQDPHRAGAAGPTGTSSR